MESSGIYKQPNEFYKNMSDEEIDRYYHNNIDDEAAFSEYISRLDWKTPPEFSSESEEQQFIEAMIAEKTQN